jgi:hypothetical protein
MGEPMTVRELIAELQKHDPEHRVFVDTSDNNFYEDSDIEDVKIDRAQVKITLTEV